MRKKILLEQFDSLSTSYQKCFFELSELKKENAKLLQKISELEEKLAQKQNEGFVVDTTISEQPQEEENEDEIIAEEIKEEKTESEEISLDDAMEYGAKIIGNIIVESAKYTDMITANPCENTKDLINLIMGKSEICKSEILTIALGELDYQTKCDLMDSQLTDALDYFKSVLAQI
ncbi:MAG: hypothetical protein IKK77_04885 [Clostridia bacterium]|nr:hypothetical protein [Clostridia bacterium]